MKNRKIWSINLVISVILIICILFANCSYSRNTAKNQKQIQVIQTNIDGKGITLQLEFLKGSAHNHPSMVLWIEDTLGNYIQTLFVTGFVAKGVYAHGDASSGKWTPGPQRRPASLPYWSHKRGIIAPDGLYIPSPETAVPDAYSAATPAGDFILNTCSDSVLKVFRLMFEINQPWDWNEYWTNNKYPDDKEYKTSCQPALVYAVTIDMNHPAEVYELRPIGHSHYAGKTGELFENLNTITTALKITASLKVTLK